jgi:molecular chaperone HtpG
MAHLRRLVTGKALDMIKDLGEQEPEDYNRFWETYGQHLKEGVAIEQDQPERLFPLLRFRTNQQMEAWSSLDDYLERTAADQQEIYYILGEDPSVVRFSPHMDAFRKADLEVLVLTDPVDSFMLLRLKEYKEHTLVNVAEAAPPAPKTESDEPEEPAIPQETAANLVARFKNALGERVSDVRTTTRLTDSPARLVDPEGAPDQSVQRVYRMMNKSLSLPEKVLEINPRHPIIRGLSLLEQADPKFEIIAEQIYENTLLIEGLHPDPVRMIGRIQDLMQTALGKPPDAS